MLGKKRFVLKDFADSKTASDLDRHLDDAQEEVDGKIDRRKTFKTTTPATANAEFKIIHGLSYKPTSYLLVSANASGQLYKSTSEWTNKVAYFKHTGTSVAIEVILW